MCYTNDMKNWNEIISRNIVEYRKLNKLTQSELADKLSFSDKSISKWERGEAIPDVTVLISMCEIFGITLNEIVSEKETVVLKPKRTESARKLLITLISAGLVWLVVTLAFVSLLVFAPEFKYGWLGFVYAIPITAIVCLVFSCVWRKKWYQLACISVLIWSVLVSICLTLGSAFWDFIYIGIPLQVLAILWYLLLGTFIKKTKEKTTFDKTSKASVDTITPAQELKEN